MYRLTVIITTYNRQHLLPRAIESVREAGKDVEVIVVDDASTDTTREFCESIDWINYIRFDKNQGTAAARNAGLAASSAPYIAFLDDDDWRLPGSFDAQLSLLEKNPQCGLVHGRVLVMDQNNEWAEDTSKRFPFPKGDVQLNLLNKNFITLSSVIVRKDCFNKIGPFDTSSSMLGLEDWDMWLRISGQYEVMAITDPVAVYRIPERGSGQWYSDIGRQFLRASRAYKKKWFRLPGVKEKLGKDLRATKDRIGAWASDVIIYDALNHSASYWEKWKRLRQVAQCWPSNLLQLKFYKALARAVWKTNGRSVDNN